MTRQFAERDKAITEFAQQNPEGFQIKATHEYMLSVGVQCSYKTVMRDFLWLHKHGRLERLESGLYRMAGTGGDDA